MDPKAQTSTKRRRSENTEARIVVEHGFAMAEALAIETIIVNADPLDVAIIDSHRGANTVLWLTPDATEFPIEEDDRNIALQIPEARLSRASRVQLGLFLAVANDHIGHSETVLCLAGGAGSARVDSVLIMNPRRDFPWFKGTQLWAEHARFRTPEFARILEIALRFSAEGREGKPIGTIFVLGDLDDLTPHLKQIVLNPCAGHPKKSRRLHSEGFIETVREFAAMDGAFVIGPNGVVESAGTYLDAPARKVRLPLGLGARHSAAAAITATTDAIAVVVSESSGAVTVFQAGKTILTLDKS